MAAHSSILAWKIPWTEEPGWLQSMGSQRVAHNWSCYAYPNQSARPINLLLNYSLFHLILLSLAAPIYGILLSFGWITLVFPNWFACLQSIFCPAVILMCVQNSNIIIVFSLKLYMALSCLQSTMNPNYSLWLTSWSDPCLSLFPPPTQSSHTESCAQPHRATRPLWPCVSCSFLCFGTVFSSAAPRRILSIWGKLPSDTVRLQDKCQVWVKCPMCAPWATRPHSPPVIVNCLFLLSLPIYSTHLKENYSRVKVSNSAFGSAASQLLV